MCKSKKSKKAAGDGGAASSSTTSANKQVREGVVAVAFALCRVGDGERPYDGAPHRSKLEMQACCCRSHMRGLGCTRTAPQSGCAHAGVAGALDGLGQLGLRDSAGQAPGGRTVWSADEAARGVRVGHGRAHQRRRRRACRGGACRGSGGLLSLWQRNAQGRAVRRRAADTRVDVRGAPRRARAPTAAMAETPPPPAPTTIIRSGAAHRSGWFLLFAHLPRATRISVSVPIPVEAPLRIP